MTRLLAALLALILVLPAMAQPPAPNAAQPTPDDRARQWLTLIDDSNYTAGIEQMGPQTAKGSIEALSRLREPLGAMATRNLKEIRLEKTHPGLPEGQYAVVRYDSTFANRAKATETLTLAMLKSGAWTVIAYQVE